jgi:short-subunit dehydrogenase
VYASYNLKREIMNAVITGASKGFGKAFAEQFASAGYNLFLCARNESVLAETASELKERFSDVSIHTRAVDLSSKTQALEFAGWVLKESNSVDILINNAGQFLPGSVYNEPEGTLERMIEVNLYSAYYITRMLVPQMIKQKAGHIFNICSIAALKAYDNGGAYSISKYALAGFSRNLREEMKPFNIKVTAVYPGAAYTDSWAGTGIDPERIMESEDISKLVFSASQLSHRACVEDIIVRPQLGDL